MFTAELQRDAALVKFHTEGEKLTRRIQVPETILIQVLVTLNRTLHLSSAVLSSMLLTHAWSSDLSSLQELEAVERQRQAEATSNTRVSKRAMIANLFNISTPPTAPIVTDAAALGNKTASPTGDRRSVGSAGVAGGGKGHHEYINLGSGEDARAGRTSLPPLLLCAIAQYEEMRDSAASDVTLQDVLRIQVERLRVECDEFCSDHNLSPKP